MMRQPQANVNSDITCCKMCSTLGDANTTTGSVLRGFADRHPETEILKRHLKLGVCGRFADMSLTKLKEHACLSAESQIPDTGTKLKRKWFNFSFWTLGWWQKGVAVEVGMNTLPGWSRWCGLWKPCQSRCSWPETQCCPQQWLGGSRAFTPAVTMCPKHREWLQQCLQPASDSMSGYLQHYYRNRK